MRSLFLIISISLLLGCGGSKKVIQEASDSTLPTSIETIEERNKAPKVIVPVEEKTPDTTIEKIEPKVEKVSISNKNEKTNIEIFDHQLWNSLLQKHVSDKGIVNYKGFKKDRQELKAYLDKLSKNIPKKDWTKSDKLAYWINLYNAFTIQLIINNYPLKSIKDIKAPWDFRFIKLETKWYTLNDIEHRILRKMGDPRIHFGINCASFSCPLLLNKAFTSQNVDSELEKLTVNFINDPIRNVITENSVQLSKIFTWFAKDFRTDGSLINFLNKYSKVTIKDNAKRSFKKYNWDLNE
ncbi:DUF547 domain-containing protein [Aquimarina sediminis]|uniref:DUF547 domain-containing protein n=1 Tax=Aquimarina sediminis TaxID=2070536 RepID=UPI000CA059C4|nr:DUF547 domain-containing protein [Aquimarina sediminis]